MISAKHAAACTDIESLCRRYSHSGAEPGTHALAYKILGIMQRHGVLAGLPVVREPNGSTQTPTDRTEANDQKEKGRGEQ